MAELLEERRTEFKRIQFEFSPDAVARLERIKRETGTGSYAELVRNAVRIYEWVLEMQNQGFDIGIVKDDSLVKIVKFMY